MSDMRRDKPPSNGDFGLGCCGPIDTNSVASDSFDTFDQDAEDIEFMFAEDTSAMSTMFACLRKHNLVELRVLPKVLDVQDCVPFSQKIAKIRNRMMRRFPLNTWHFVVDLGDVKRLDHAFLRTLIDEIESLRCAGVVAHCVNVRNARIREMFRAFNLLNALVLDGPSGII